MNGVIFDTHAV